MAATVVPSVIINLKALNKDNYEDWNFRVKTFLVAKGLWKVLETTTIPFKQENDEAELDAWNKNNAEALHTIHISCGDEAYTKIRGINSAKTAWDTLAKEFKSIDEGSPDERSDCETDHSPTDGDADPRIDLEIEAVEEHGSIKIYANNYDIYGLFEDADAGNWETVTEFIIQHPEAVRALHPSRGITILQNAVIAKQVKIVKELVLLAERAEDLEIQDVYGDTVLHYAVVQKYSDIIETAICMLEKNRSLASIVNPSTNMIPLLLADALGKVKMAHFLYSVTPFECLINYCQGAELISRAFSSKNFDIAWDLLHRFPSLGFAEDFSGESPINKLASMRSAFVSESRLRFWEQWIYDSMDIKPTVSETCINIGIYEQSKQPRLIHSVIDSFRRLVVMNLLKILGINRIRQLKLTHVRILEFLHSMCEVIKNNHLRPAEGIILKRAIFQAVEGGHAEFIVHIIKANPDLLHITNEENMTIFHFAAECRQENVFSLIYGLSEIDKARIIGGKDHNGNNMLHTVGNLSNFRWINDIRGAALEMKRDLEWFKEVEGLGRTDYYEAKNREGCKPRELFVRNHRRLMEEAQRSMQNAAASCIILGSLIVTMMFAATFTVPGGNNQNTGIPIFLSKRVFMIFIIADTISLMFSTTSVMMFVGILTARYKKEDFIKSLPTKMILGLITLFISIVNMMIAFTSALFIMQKGELWIVLLVIVLSSFPIMTFVWMQFPFLVETFVSTYVEEAFDRNVSRWY